MKINSRLKASLITGALILCSLPGLAQESATTDFYLTHPQLEGYIRDALDANPRSREALSRYRAAIQTIPQVTALPDPTVTFTQFVRSVETRVGPQRNSLMLSQRFPWFGKLDLKGKVALREASAIFNQRRALDRKIVAGVKDAFYDLSYYDLATAITREEQVLLQHYEQLAQTRYASGQGLQQGVIKIQAEITKTLNRLEILSQQRISAAARLNTLRNRSPQELVGPADPVELPAVDLDLEELYAIGEAHRPELLAAVDRIEKEELAGTLAEKDYWPDVTVSAGFINLGGRDDTAGIVPPPPDNSKNAYSLSVGINIPLRRDRYRAGVLAAAERRRAEQEYYASIVADMKFNIRDQAIRIETIGRQIDLYDSVLIPQAESALQATETGYETGQLRALDLLDSERVLLDVRLARARLVSDYMRALARLELALGTRFPHPEVSR